MSSRWSFRFPIFKLKNGVLVWCLSAVMLICWWRLTTHAPREASDVLLQRWSEIGLPRASTIRLTKLATIDLIHHKIGRLHPDDARAVSQAWQQMTNVFVAELLK